MSKIFAAIKKIFISGIVKAIPSVVAALKEIMKYLNGRAERSERAKKEKTVEKAEKKVDEACDNGNLCDLFDATHELGSVMKKIKQVAAVAAAVCLSGCVSQRIVVEPTTTYEGRYETVDDFKAGTAGMRLADGESVWVLSNNTLKRLLKNTGKLK